MPNSQNSPGESQAGEKGRERPSRLDPLFMQSQARSLRTRSSQSIASSEMYEAPAWKKAATVAFLGLVLVAAAGLLIFSGARREMASRIGRLAAEVSGAEEGRILRLPPPVRASREAVAPSVVFRSGSSQAEGSEKSGEQEILYYNTFPDERGGEPQAAQGAQEASRTLAKTPEAEQAYQLLLEQSEAARGLAEGEAQGYEFVDWKPLSADPPVYYITLTAKDSEGAEQPLTWQVDTERGEAKALSQLARELEARLKR